MKKKIAVLAVLLATTISSFAQFQQGKPYAGASLSGLDLSYAMRHKWNFDIQGKVGYFIIDNIMFTANLEYGKHYEEPTTFKMGPGARYYIVQNGLYLGAGVDYVHKFHTYDDFVPNFQLGYCYFLSRTVTVEPELFYNQSFKNHNEYSNFGFRIGFGIYLE